jgi:hypothetical protein
MEYDLITFKQAVRDVFPFLRERPFIAWKSGNKYFIQEYIKNGNKNEVFGHEFIVDLDNKTLTPAIWESYLKMEKEN